MKDKKPPIGVMPARLFRQLVDEKVRESGGVSFEVLGNDRLKVLIDAIRVCNDKGIGYPPEWNHEFLELLSLSSPFRYNARLWVNIVP